MDNSFVPEIVTEAATELMMSQVGGDRIGYVALATEAFMDSKTQAGMVQKLYKETQKIDGVDFGKIPDSKGDLTKYAYYDQLYDCINLLNSISEGNATNNLVTMNRLHQILLDARSDFVFGFKSNNYIITNTYKCMVMSLYEMINVCVVDVTAYLRNKASIKMDRKMESRTREITKNTNRFIKMYESGQWSTLMKTFKSGAAADFAEAQEASTYDDAMQSMVSNSTPGGGVTINIDPITPITNAYKGIKTIVSKIPEIPKGIAHTVTSAWNNSKIFGKSGLIAAGVLTLLWIIRRAVYLFMHGAANLKESIKNNSEILKASIANGSNTVDGVESQKRLLDRMQKVSDTIDYKIIKSEREADADMKKADREEFSPAEIRNISGSDFEF